MAGRSIYTCIAISFLSFLPISVVNASSGTINITLSVMKSPCKINVSDVNFDDIDVDKVDGASLAKEIPYGIDCGSGNEDTPLNLTLSAVAANFGDGNVVSTNVDNFGLSIFQNGSAFTIAKPKEIKISSLPVLTAVPVKKKGSDVGTGAFSASITLTVEYS
jgi:type 1 fimbria pilin